MEIDQAVDLALVEYKLASMRYPPFNSPPEGYAVLLMELEELLDEIRQVNGHCLRTDQMKREAAHVAAMALRFLVDMF